MTPLSEQTPEALQATLRHLQARYAALQARGLKLDMTRGKPAPDQLDLSDDLLMMPGNRDPFTEGREDARNYGGVQGLAELRALFAGVLGAPPSQIVAGNNSSLALMHDCLAYALLKGVPGACGRGRARKPSASSARCRATTATSPCARPTASRCCRCR